MSCGAAGGESSCPRGWCGGRSSGEVVRGVSRSILCRGGVAGIGSSALVSEGGGRYYSLAVADW